MILEHRNKKKKGGFVENTPTEYLDRYKQVIEIPSTVYYEFSEDEFVKTEINYYHGYIAIKKNGSWYLLINEPHITRSCDVSLKENQVLLLDVIKVI